MSTLQIGLLIIGAVLVIAVYGYNKLQERRIRRRMDEAFKTSADPLLDPAPEAKPEARERIEPSMAAAGGDGQDAPPFNPPAGSVEDVAPPVPPPDALLPAANPSHRWSAARRRWPASRSAANCPIRTSNAWRGCRPCNRSLGGLLMDAVEFAYAKPCRWVVQVSGVWSPTPAIPSRIPKWRRAWRWRTARGALTEQGYAVFRGVIEELGQAIPAATIIAERAEETERAAELRSAPTLTSRSASTCNAATAGGGPARGCAASPRPQVSGSMAAARSTT